MLAKRHAGGNFMLNRYSVEVPNQPKIEKQADLMAKKQGSLLPDLNINRGYKMPMVLN